MRSNYLQPRKIIYHLFQAARVRIVKTFIAAMNQYRQPALNKIKYFVQTFVICIEMLCIRVQLYAAKTRMQNKVSLSCRIFTVRMKCAEPEKFLMRADLVYNKIINVPNLIRPCSNRQLS